MKVLITTVGSVGDVAPFTGLGRRLVSAGHEVAIATLDRYEPLVTDAGFEFRSIPTDPLAAFDPPSDAAAEEGSDQVGARERIRTAVQGMRDAKEYVADNVRGLGQDLLRVAEAGADVLLASATTAPLACHVAEGLGIPTMGVYVEAAYKTGDFAPFLGRSLGRRLNRAAGQAVFAGFDASIRATTAALREQLDLAPLTPAQLRRRQEAEGWPVCCGFSPVLVPRPADWPQGMEVVGFWWPERPSGWTPPAELTEFLAAGPPPVFVGFGSVQLPNGAEVSEVVGDALRRCGLRAVIHGGSDLRLDGDDVLVVGDTPYDWLFPQMAAAVHAGGAGTTAACLRAGIPAVTIPTMTDQHFWSMRLARVGAAPDPIPLRRLDADRLAAALDAAAIRPHHRQAAQHLSGPVAAEDGAGAVVRRLDALLGAQRQRQPQPA